MDAAPPASTRRPLEDVLRDLRDSLADEGRLDEAGVLDCFVDVAQNVHWHHNPNRGPRELFLDALQEFAPCECDPCPECGKLAAPDPCTCETCPLCGGRLPVTRAAGQVGEIPKCP